MAKKTPAQSTETPANDKESKRVALEFAMKDLTKKYGAGTVMMMDDESIQKIEALPTGSLTLDIALGIGGLPRGRIIEIYGPEGAGKSTLALHCVAEAQKAGGYAAYIDVENAMDASYAKAIGVNLQETMISQPESGEQALDIAEQVIRSNAVDIVVIDSVAALVPQAEIDGEMGDQQVGAQARLLSKAMRKLTAAINQTKTVCIFINQLREKVGVIYGCLHGDTVIPFVDGRVIPIKKVVEEHITGNVWSYNEETHVFESKPIIDWHYNGDVVSNTDYIHIETFALDAQNGTCGITVTPDHRVMTENGWTEAKNVSLNDAIATKYLSRINGTLANFFYGTAVGDSCISVRAKNTAVIRMTDNNNPDYVQWKIQKLAPALQFTANSHGVFVSNPSSELAIIKNEIQERNPLALLRDHYSDLGLAVWYMDDGHFDTKNNHHRAIFSIKRFKKNEAVLSAISDEFTAKGFNNTYRLSDGSITLTSEATSKLFDTIAQYVPDTMQYKLDAAHQGKYEDFALEAPEVYKTAFVKVRSIRYSSPRQMRVRGKYDISVENNHNYLAGNYANGILVHNSPETQPGGRALKFYSSVRLDIRKQDVIKDGSTVIGNKVKVKVVKNKVAPPFKEAFFDIMFGKGVDAIGEILDIGVNYEIVQKAGAFYSYNGEKLGQGRDNAKRFLAENPTIMEQLTHQVRDAIFQHSKNTTPIADSIDEDDADFDEM